jgi:hypothetical protein
MATRRLTSPTTIAPPACAPDANHACARTPGKRAHPTTVVAQHRSLWRDSHCLPGRLLWRLLLWGAAIGLYTPHGVQAQKPTEYQVEATYLYNFSQFVQWPSRAIATSDSFDICVLGQDPFGPALNTILANETIGGKPVAAKRILTPDDAANCRVLFISSSENLRVKEILTALGGASVLTVSDLPRFTERGGMLQFLLMDDRVRFEVNLSATQRAGLSLSSELLKVAINVRRTMPPGD